MLANILKLGGASLVIATYYYLTNVNRIRINNPHLSRLFRTLKSQKPQYTQPLFKILLSLNLLEQHPQLSPFVLQAGFDPEGTYIEQIKNLGFGGIEVGPTSFNPSLEEDLDQHLGIMNALASISHYKDKFRKEQFIIELNIAPNLQILKYTPYLMKENLLGALSHYIRIQQRCPYDLVKTINFSFERAGCSLPQAGSAEVKKMMQQIKGNAEESLKQQLKDSPSVTFSRSNPQKYMDWNALLDYITKPVE